MTNINENFWKIFKGSAKKHHHEVFLEELFHALETSKPYITMLLDGITTYNIVNTDYTSQNISFVVIHVKSKYFVNPVYVKVFINKVGDSYEVDEEVYQVVPRVITQTVYEPIVLSETRKPIEERINFYTKAGSKIKLHSRWQHSGWDSERAEIAKLFKPDVEYTLKAMDVGRNDSKLEVEEYPNKRFNTVFFTNSGDYEIDESDRMLKYRYAHLPPEVFIKDKPMDSKSNAIIGTATISDAFDYPPMYVTASKEPETSNKSKSKIEYKTTYKGYTL